MVLSYFLSMMLQIYWNGRVQHARQPDTSCVLIVSRNVYFFYFSQILYNFLDFALPFWILIKCNMTFLFGRLVTAKKRKTDICTYEREDFQVLPIELKLWWWWSNFKHLNPNTQNTHATVSILFYSTYIFSRKKCSKSK